MPRDDDLSQRQEYRPSDQLAPPQPDRSWRENGNGKTGPAMNPAWEPPVGLHFAPAPEPQQETYTQALPDPLFDADARLDTSGNQEYGVMTPPLEPDEVIDPDPGELPGASVARTLPPSEVPNKDALLAFPRSADPGVPTHPERLSVQEQYDILLHTIALYKTDWKLSCVRAHEESGRLKAFLISRHHPMSIREAHERDQLLIITVDTEGNTEIREPAGRNPKSGRWRWLWGGGNGNGDNGH